MPLVVVAGTPCSGKSTRARELAAVLRATLPGDARVCIVTDGPADDSHREMYAAALEADMAQTYACRAQEGRVRAALLSAVQRLLDAKTYVILDAPNNVSGFRYQLFCAAREARTPYCVLWCTAWPQTCRARLHRRVSARTAPGDYDEATFDALSVRFETPNAEARWDAPLFVATSPEDDAGADAAVAGVFAEMSAVLCGAPARAATAATTLAAGAASVSADVFAAIERESQAVLDLVSAGLAGAGGAPAEIAVAQGTKGAPLCVTVRRNPMAGELQSLRRQFLRMSRGSSVSVADVRSLFSSYLSANLS